MGSSEFNWTHFSNRKHKLLALPRKLTASMPPSLGHNDGICNDSDEHRACNSNEGQLGTTTASVRSNEPAVSHQSNRPCCSPLNSSSKTPAGFPAVGGPSTSEEDVVGEASAMTAAESEVKFQDAYSLENVIGCGSYSSVYRCVSRTTGENFAVKVINDRVLSSYQRQLIYNEEAILRRLDHRNVIKLVAVFSNEPEIKRMIFEFADQLDVCVALVTSPNFGEAAIRSAARQLFNGLVYLHEMRLVHRDLKLENLLVKSESISGEMVLKISDFGYAFELPPGQKTLSLKNTWIGSFEYMSPELISSKEYSVLIDCWAAGVIIYFLFTGDFPFNGANLSEMVRCIVRRQFTLDFSAPEWQAVSCYAVKFIKCILSSNYDRPNAAQLLKHPWLSAPEDDPKNLGTDQPLPIMRHKKRLEFLQQQAEMRQKRLYNNSSSYKLRLGCDPNLHIRRRRHCWQASGSHEEVLSRELIIDSVNSRRRSRSLSPKQRRPLKIMTW